MSTLEEERIYDVLIEVARSKSVITYDELCVRASLPYEMANPDHRNQLSQCLADISSDEVDQGHPMLSAVVVRAEDGYPGSSFFKFAAEMGLCANKMKEEDQAVFFAEELKKVHDFWS